MIQLELDELFNQLYVIEAEKKRLNLSRYIASFHALWLANYRLFLYSK